MTARRRLFLAVAGLAAVAAVLAIALGGGSGRRPRTAHRLPARLPLPSRSNIQLNAVGQAATFLDSLGVATHLNYADTSYGRQTAILARLEELGIRHIREGVPFRSPTLAHGLRRARKLGLRATLVTDLKIEPRVAVADAARTIAPNIDAFEGPNELDHSGIPDWRVRLVRYMRALRAAVDLRRPATPVLGPSFVDPDQNRVVPQGVAASASLHPYPDGAAPESVLPQKIQRGRASAPGRAIEITETGYENALAAPPGTTPVPEWVAAVYLPRLFLWSYAMGVSRTFVYELADEKPDPRLLDPEQHYGLLRQDLSRKPAFEGLRNLIVLVRGPADGGGDSHPPSVRAAAPIDVVRLSRADGSQVLALWRPVSVWDTTRRAPVGAGPVSVHISWPRKPHAVLLSRPAISPRPRAANVGDSASLDIPVGVDVVLVDYH